MDSIARNENQLTLVYSSATRQGKRTLAHVNAVKFAEVQTIDIAETKLTGTQWAEIAQGLNIEIKKLIDFEEVSEEEEKKFDGDFDEDAYINILNNNPKLFTHSVAIMGDVMKQIKNPTDIQQFIEVDSAGLKKNMMDDQPDITKQTKGEKFVEKKGEQKQEDSAKKGNA